MNFNKKSSLLRIRYFVICFSLLVFATAIIVIAKKLDMWSSFVSNGKVTTEILKKNGKLIFGTTNSKLYFLKSNRDFKIYDLNTGSASWTKIHGNDVLVASDDTLRSIRVRDQRLNWKVSTPNQTLFIKVEVVKGVLLAGSADGALSAYRIADGKQLWTFSTKSLGNLSSIYSNYSLHYFGNFIFSKGVVYLASQDNNLYAIDLKSGKQLWINNIGELITSGPVINNGTINVGTVSGKSISISSKNGNTLWSLAGGDNMVCETTHRNSIFFGKKALLELYSNGTLIYRRSDTGDVLWQLDGLGSNNSCFIIWKSKVITTSVNGELSLVSLRSGKIVYTRSGLGEIVTSPIVQPRFGKIIPNILDLFSPGVVVGNTAGTLFKINAFNGDDVWQFSVDVPSTNFFSLIGNNVYFSTTNSVTYKIDSTTGTSKISLNDRIFSVSQQTKRVADSNIIELTLKSSSDFENPWVQADIYVIFVDENGDEYKVPGFYYDQEVWKVRFNPPKKGEWMWKVYWLPHGRQFTKSGKFISTTDTNNYYLKISKDNPRRLTLDGKNIFNGIGLGDSMDDYNSNGTPHDDWAIGNGNQITRDDASLISKSDVVNTLDTYISTYGPSGAGFNVIRWSLMNASQSQYTSIDSPQTYSILQGKIGDQFVEKLRENDIHIWLTMFGFDIPYKYDNSPGSVNLLRSYIKYLFARYGAYVDVWELANELSVPQATSEIMINEIRQIDYEHRPISVSSTGYNFSESDIIAPHWYETESISESDTRTSNQIKKYSSFNKPIVFAEQGNSTVNYDSSSGVRMRIRSWTAFFEEGILIFWNQSDSINFTAKIFPANLYIGEEERKYINILQSLTSSFPTNSKKVHYDLNPNGVRGYGLLSESVSGAYFYHYASPFTSTKFEVNLSTHGGKYKWVDPSTGVVLGSGICTNMNCKLESPEFKTDIAVFIIKD